ncbi:hypothetical protein F4678DRAFT_467263 [Xylaria arbuscula]|nr:hypothetical protein F4678DRAFT_467263 [Xylaria arbuscula]
MPVPFEGTMVSMGKNSHTVAVEGKGGIDQACREVRVSEFLIWKRPESIQYARYPVVPPTDAVLAVVREYVRAIANNINSAEATQQKRRAKGKGPRLGPKEAEETGEADHLRRQQLPDLAGKIDDMKKAMPFVQTLRRGLQAGKSENKVLERNLVFDEVSVLRQMLPGQ